MRSRFTFAAMTLWVLGSPGAVSGQFSGAGTTVTITVPVNLTQLSPDLERVRFICGITSDAMAALPQNPMTVGLQDLLQPKDEVLVLGGQLVTTMKVIAMIPIELLPEAAGKPAEYNCRFDGFSRSLQRWEQLHEGSTVPAFNLKGLSLAGITGTFNW